MKTMTQRSEAQGDIYSTLDGRQRRGLRVGTVALQGGRRITKPGAEMAVSSHVSGYTGGAPHLSA